MDNGLTVLGIETSCDETAVAVVGDNPRPLIRANLIHSQLAEHAPYGGVVPEIAARAHLDHIEGLIKRALAEAETSLDRVDGVPAAGGAGIEQAARGGAPHRFALPRPLKGRAGCDFSFSGLKTAVRQIVADMDARAGPLGPQDIADLAASVELAICDTLLDRTANAISWFRRHHPEGTSLVAAGGVAA